MKLSVMKKIVLMMPFFMLLGCISTRLAPVDNNQEKKIEKRSEITYETVNPVSNFPEFYREYYELNTVLTEIDCKEIVKESIDEDEPDFQGMIDAALEYYDEAQRYWAEGDLDNAVETLDKSYALVIDVRAQNNHDLDQQINNLRFMISKRIQEVYASSHTTVKGPYKEIPLDMNKHVEKELKRFLGPERKFFINSYQRSGRYRAQIVSVLKEAGLPEELSWLPLVESGFKIKALSRARALGLWQFIPSTGYKFGLKRDRFIDQRMNAEKSTVAAAAYLKELHHIFGDWTTVDRKSVV